MNSPLNLSKYHDAKLLGILLKDDKTIQLTLLSVEGEYFSLVMEKVKVFVGNNFREGNTVLSVEILDADELMFLTSVESALAEMTGSDRAFAESAVMASRNEAIKFLEISPSFGASIYCLCGSVRECAIRAP